MTAETGPTYDDLAASLGIEAEITDGPKPSTTISNGTAFHVLLWRQTKHGHTELETPWHQGSAHGDTPPTAGKVLQSLATEASMADEYPDPWDMMTAYGVEATREEHARAVATIEAAAALRVFLHDDYDAAVYPDTEIDDAA
jgi:hypothetical protein